MTLSLFSVLPVELVRRRGQGGVVTPILPLAGARLRFFLFLTVVSLRHFLSHRVWGLFVWLMLTDGLSWLKNGKSGSSFGSSPSLKPLLKPQLGKSSVGSISLPAKSVALPSAAPSSLKLNPCATLAGLTNNVANFMADTPAGAGGIAGNMIAPGCSLFTLSVVFSL